MVRLRPAGQDGPAPCHDPRVWRIWADEEQKRVGREMWVRMEKVVAVVLHEAHRLQIEEAMDALEEGPEGFYKSYLED